MPGTKPQVFTKYKPQRASDQIASEIKKSIVSKKFPEGERLPSERALAEQFGVSRLTIRDALRLLEIQGLIVKKKGSAGGAFVQPASKERIADAIMDMLQFDGISMDQMDETRVVMETGIVRCVIDNATEEDLMRLDANTRQLKKHLDKAEADTDAIAGLIIEFHQLLAEATHILPLIIIQRAILEWGIKTLRHYKPPREEYQNHYESHRQIVDAIKEGNVLLAQALVEKHIRKWSVQLVHFTQ